MNRFLNLSTSVINKCHIIEIVKHSNKYSIYMSNSKIKGYFIMGFLLSGALEHNIIEICKKKDAEDYKIITDFILDMTKPDK